MDVDSKVKVLVKLSGSSSMVVGTKVKVLSTNCQGLQDSKNALMF